MLDARYKKRNRELTLYEWKTPADKDTNYNETIIIDFKTATN